ncbi:hypothetical protein AA0311_0251 [Asaia bogorensis NBRC 16594]|nr:hypothetical protein Asbog_00694 [Asaia bogorensis NBRC 16594]GBQ73586.1 hypothetical protein AA0311_0251 [Asaia bogorensis NBRC 16594]
MIRIACSDGRVWYGQLRVPCQLEMPDLAAFRGKRSVIQSAIAVILGLIIGLFSLIVSIIAVIEEAARRGLQALGVPHQVQTSLLALLLLLLVVVSFRLFGKLFGLLIAIVLLALLLHALFAPEMTGVTI